MAFPSSIVAFWAGAPRQPVLRLAAAPAGAMVSLSDTGKAPFGFTAVQDRCALRLRPLSPRLSGRLWLRLAAAEDVPLPRPRPPIWVEPQTFREAAGPDFNTAEVTSAPTACDDRLAKFAAIEPMPRLIGPGACGGGDMVQLDAVLLADGSRMSRSSRRRCSTARWRNRSPAGCATRRRRASPSSAVRCTAVENYDDFECRSRNRVTGAKLSDHGHGDRHRRARVHLADGRRIELTDVTVDKPLREALRESACARFTTVLGPGATAITKATSIST